MIVVLFVACLLSVYLFSVVCRPFVVLAFVSQLAAVGLLLIQCPWSAVHFRPSLMCRASMFGKATIPGDLVPGSTEILDYDHGPWQ